MEVKFLKEIENENNFDYYFTPISNLIDLKKGVNMSIVMPYHDSLKQFIILVQTTMG